MSEDQGYSGNALDCLKKNNVKEGDSIKITADLTYSGILMPRYESSDDKHLVIKLGSGYNVGINIDEIKEIQVVSSSEVKPKQSEERKKDPELPKILLLSTGGTIASKVDYRTGAVTPALSASDLNEAVPELGKIANIDTEVLFSEYSENLQPDHWTKIAEKLDSLAKSKMNEENIHGETILSQMLTEMEDSGTSNIMVIGITNRPDLIDNSMLRNGRLDIVLFVQPPDEKSRLDIIKILTDGMPLASDISLNEIAVSTQNYTGADLASLCREAAVNAMQRDSPKISSNDFAIGLKRVRPSITKDINKWYNDITAEVSNIIPKSSGETFYR